MDIVEFAPPAPLLTNTMIIERYQSIEQDELEKLADSLNDERVAMLKAFDTTTPPDAKQS